jgi:predicted RNase H-like nuclease (RuvC/YqgF family)
VETHSHFYEENKQRYRKKGRAEAMAEVERKLAEKDERIRKLERQLAELKG